MKPFITKGSLAWERRRLVELMQDLHFGQIVNLRLRKGQPVFDPPPRLIRDRKLGSEEAPRSASPSDDFLLKRQVVDLFTSFDQIHDGTIDLIEVKHGLPFRLQYTEGVAPCDAD